MPVVMGAGIMESKWFGLVWTLKVEFQPPALVRGGTHYTRMLKAQPGLEQFQGFWGMRQHSQTWWDMALMPLAHCLPKTPRGMLNR